MGRRFLLTICGILNIPIFASGAEELLVVKKGTGVSFIDLWNLKGYQVGSVTDDIYRNGIIDNGFTEDCPSFIYFNLADSSLQTKHIYIKFSETDNNTLQSWMTTDNIDRLAFNIDKTNVDLKFSPNEDIQLQLDKKGTQNDFYFFVHHAEDKAPYPIYYTVTNDYTVAGPIPPADITQLVQAHTLKITARYDSVDCFDALRLKNDTKWINSTESKNKIKEIKSRATTTLTQTSTTDATKVSHDTTTTTSTSETPTDTPDKATTATTNPSVTTTMNLETLTTASTSEKSTVVSEKTTVTTNPSVTTTISPDTSTTTSDSIVTKTSSTTSGISTQENMCPCDCEYKRRLDILNKRSDIPIEELKRILAPEIEEIKANYTVDVSKLSSTRRKKRSATDKRKSSEQIGIVGIVFIAFVFGLVLLVDLVALKRHLQVFRNRILID